MRKVITHNITLTLSGNEFKTEILSNELVAKISNLVNKEVNRKNRRITFDNDKISSDLRFNSSHTYKTI